jgi:hypothetical protein
MKTIRLSTIAAALTIFSTGASLAITVPAAANAPAAPLAANEFQPMAFSDSAEAGMLHRAYHILATGDHDYKGRRVRAMRQVKAAAGLLGLDLSGDDRDKEKQVLSDDRLREADGLLNQVLGSSEVNAQKKVVRHLHAAVKEIHAALNIH